MISLTFSSGPWGPKCLKYQNVPNLGSFWAIGKPWERFQRWDIIIYFIPVPKDHTVLSILQSSFIIYFDWFFLDWLNSWRWGWKFWHFSSWPISVECSAPASQLQGCCFEFQTILLWNRKFRNCAHFLGNRITFKFKFKRAGMKRKYLAV